MKKNAIFEGYINNQILLPSFTFNLIIIKVVVQHTKMSSEERFLWVNILKVDSFFTFNPTLQFRSPYIKGMDPHISLQHFECNLATKVSIYILINFEKKRDGQRISNRKQKTTKDTSWAALNNLKMKSQRSLHSRGKRFMSLCL